MMDNRDTPIIQEETVDRDAPIMGAVEPLRSEASDNRYLIQAAFMDSYYNGQHPLDNYRARMPDNDKRASALDAAMRKASMDTQTLIDNFVLNPRESTGDIRTGANAVQTALEQVQQTSLDPDLNYAESIVGEDFSQEAIDRVAARTKLHHMLSDWEEEISGWDVAGEVAKNIFIPFIQSYRGAKLTGQYFGQQDSVKDAIRRFTLLSPEEQVSVFPQLREELVDKVGEVQALSIMNAFTTAMADEGFDQFGVVDKVFDVLDATGLGLAFKGALRGIQRSSSVVRDLQDVGNTEEAARLAAASLVDPEVGRAVGMADSDAVATALPFDTSIEEIGRVGGLSPEVQRELDSYFRSVDTTAQDIMLGRGFLKEGILNTKEIDAREAAAMNIFKAEEMEDIRVLSRDENTTTFVYKARDEFDQPYDQEFTLNLTLNDVGTFEQSTAGLIRELVASPTAFARGMFAKDVETATRLEYLTARIQKQLTDLTNEALRPIGLIPTPSNRASLARLDKALREGDTWRNADGTRGTIFTPDDLREKFGFKNENEISAYYRVNRLYNNLFHIRNHEKRQELIALGYSNLNILQTGESMIAKPYADGRSASAALRSNSIDYVYDEATDSVIDLRATGNAIEEAYGDGKVLVRADEPYRIDGERGAFRYILTSSDNITDLPEQVLHWKAGYVPRIYEDAAYFVKETQPDMLVDGNKEVRQSPRTLRFFDNKRDADAYVAQLKARYIEDALNERGVLGMDPEDAAIVRKQIEAEAEGKYISLMDREEQMITQGADDITHGTAGLYTGARADDALLYGLNGDEATRVNSFESLIRNITNVSRYTSINQWRLGLEQRWINTANEVLAAKGLNTRVTGFNKLGEQAEAVEEVRFLNRVYDQIRDWQGFPTAEERAFNTMAQNLYDYTRSKDYDRVAKALGHLRGFDPIAAARATAFHTLLGFLNPAQYWIQAQGAAVAASLGFGKYSARSLREQFGLQSLGYGAVDDARIARAAKISGIDADEMKALHEMWVKTGYQDSVYQTADYAAASKGYGMSQAVVKEALHGGLFFYRAGELFNRRFSFSTAVQRYLERNTEIKSLTEIGDEGLKAIMDDANAMMLNMTKANRAPWQKGFLSLPTQFLQVTTKFTETALGANQKFTLAERGRMITGQLIMYGAAGTPLVALGPMILAQVFGMTQEDIDNNPTLVKTWNDGFWGFLTYEALGLDIEMSSRGSLVRGISDFIDRWTFEESTMADKMLGAFGSTGTRFWDEFTRQIRPFTLSNAVNLEPIDAVKVATLPVLRSISTWRNTEQAIMMQRLGISVNTRGAVMESGDFDPLDVVAQAIGFQRTLSSEMYDLNKISREQDNYVRKIQSEIMKAMNEFALMYPDGGFDDEALERHMDGINFLYGTLDPDEQLRVARAIEQSYKRGALRDQAVGRRLESLKNTTADQLSLWRTAIMGTKMFRLNPPAEDQE